MSTTRTESVSSRSGGGGGVKPVRFVRESVSELRKVLWPSRNELVTYSIVVIVFLVIMVAVVAGFDVGFTRAVLAVFG